MTTLNRDAADALRPFAPNAVTDVTGFGLLGHAHEMAERSGVRIELDAASLPLFPGALEQARGGGPHGRRPAQPRLRRPARRGGRRPRGRCSRSRTTRRPSGGLLVSLPADKAPVLQASSPRRLFARRVGRVVEGAGVALRDRGAAPRRGRAA